MSETPELWVFVFANIGLFVVSSVLTVLTYIAYRQRQSQTSFLIAAVGFGLIVLGGLVEPFYELVVRGDPNLNATELLWLQSGEGVLIASGLGVLFYALTQHSSGSSSAEENRYTFGPEETDD